MIIPLLSLSCAVKPTVPINSQQQLKVQTLLDLNQVVVGLCFGEKRSQGDEEKMQGWVRISGGKGGWSCRCRCQTNSRNCTVLFVEQREQAHRENTNVTSGLVCEAASRCRGSVRGDREQSPQWILLTVRVKHWGRLPELSLPFTKTWWLLLISLTRHSLQHLNVNLH